MISLRSTLCRASSGLVARPRLQALAWMAGTLTGFTFMAISGRALATEMSVVQIIFVRSAIALVIVALFVPRRGWRLLHTKRLGLHLLRNIAHFGGQYGWFLGVAMIPLAQVFAIEFTTPIWTILLAAWLLGERLTGARIWAVILGIVGIAIILRPGAAGWNIAALAVLGAAFAYAVSYILTKKLTATESPLAILFYMNLFQLPMALLPSLPVWVTPSPAMWPWAVVVAVAGLLAHYCLARALALADAAFIVPLDFLRLPLIALVGAGLYGEPIEIMVLVGAAVIMFGSYVNSRGPHRSATMAGGSPGDQRKR